MPKILTRDLEPIPVEPTNRFSAYDIDQAYAKGFGHAVIGITVVAMAAAGIGLITDSGDQSTGVSVNQLTDVNTHGCPEGKPEAHFQVHTDGIRINNRPQPAANYIAEICINSPAVTGSYSVIPHN